MIQRILDDLSGLSISQEDMMLVDVLKHVFSCFIQQGIDCHRAASTFFPFLGDTVYTWQSTLIITLSETASHTQRFSLLLPRGISCDRIFLELNLT